MPVDHLATVLLTLVLATACGGSWSWVDIDGAQFAQGTSELQWLTKFEAGDSSWQNLGP